MSFEDTSIEEDGFGLVPRPRDAASRTKLREIVRRYTLTNKHEASVRLISWGASIQSIRIPNRDGKLADVVLGFDDMDGYSRNRFVGSVIGRVANRTSTSLTRLNGAFCSTSIDEEAERARIGGGPDAFDNVNWQSQIVDNRVVMSRLSRVNGDGRASDLLTQIKYSWTDDSRLHVNIRATATRPTPVDITNYCLFNLAGHGAGPEELRRHVLTVNADRWTVVDMKSGSPTGTISPVDCTVLELRLPVQLNRRRLFSVPGGGYNHTLCVNSPSYWCYRFHARILHPASGRFMEVYSNHPGLRVYTGNDLPHPERAYPPDLQKGEWGDCADARVDPCGSAKTVERRTVARSVCGKGGVPYRRHGGFALSPQNYPNAVNVQHFPSCVLRPGKAYTHDMTYKFGVHVAR